MDEAALSRAAVVVEPLDFFILLLSCMSLLRLCLMRLLLAVDNTVKVQSVCGDFNSSF